MRQFYPLLAALGLLPTCAQAQAPADSATFLLHKFAQRIGKETYHLTRTAQAYTYDVDFKFVDLGAGGAQSLAGNYARRRAAAAGR